MSVHHSEDEESWTLMVEAIPAMKSDFTPVVRHDLSLARGDFVGVQCRMVSTEQPFLGSLAVEA